VKDIVFIQCVGSRDQTTGNLYCSRICCMVNAKQAHIVRENLPSAKVTVFYADVRAFGKGHEEFYDLVRKEGVHYRRGYVSEVFKRGERIIVRAEDTLMQKPVEIEADLVVLGTGLTPRAETDEIANVLGLPRSGDGFLLEIHPKLRPVETAVDGVFLAGTCQGPKDIVDTIAQARAAASSALAPLCHGKVKIESATASVTEELCAGCGVCVATCPYGAPALNTRTGKARVNAVLCKGCGACQAACPSKAIQVMQFTPRQIISEITALV
jgi:heterodisulfide reductase subunit A